MNGRKCSGADSSAVRTWAGVGIVIAAAGLRVLGSFMSARRVERDNPILHGRPKRHVHVLDLVLIVVAAKPDLRLGAGWDIDLTHV